jgi:hypothetical protein
METSLHHQLKALYSAHETAREVRLGGFRIDAVADGELIEIQQASLGALRDKVRKLLEGHRVTVVKPLAARKRLVRLKRAGGPVVQARYSPRQETIADLFADLVYFVGVFPHPRLTLQVLFVELDEHRVPRRKRRWNGPDYRVVDRVLVGVQRRLILRTRSDLVGLLPAGLEPVFSTADLAQRAAMPRWLAQKMAYCLRNSGAIEAVGKRGGAWLYRIADDDEQDRAA